MEASVQGPRPAVGAGASYTYLRQFTPNVLAAIDFKGGPGTTDLMAAVAILKTLNETGGRKVPADAPKSSCRPGTPTIWPRLARAGTTPLTGTTGSYA